MYQYKLTSKTPFTFSTRIIHFVYGKSYDFVTLVDIPSNTPKGTIVLTSTVSPFTKTVNYLWENVFDPFAFEIYVKAISFTFFQNAFNKGKSGGISVMNSALKWLGNYEGNRDWKKEYSEIILDLNNFDTYGKANILSKLRELKSSKLGIHYNDENSYQRKIIDDSYYMDTNNWEYKEIKEETKINSGNKKNYFYFYLKEGKGEINIYSFLRRKLKFNILFKYFFRI